MRTITKAVLAATAFAAIPAAASAQSVATADLETAVANSAAMKNATQQIRTQFATQITAFQTRETAIQNELRPLATELQTLQNTPNTPPATFQTKAQAFQTRREAGTRELQTLSQPFARPTSYAQEQVLAKIEPAVRAAMTAKNVSVLVKPDAVLAFGPTGDITADVTAQLDKQVTSVSITPPAGWQPGQQQAAAAAPAAATPAAPAAATPAPAAAGRRPTGR